MIKLNKEEKGYLERIADALEEYVGNNSGSGEDSAPFPYVTMHIINNSENNDLYAGYHDSGYYLGGYLHGSEGMSLWYYLPSEGYFTYNFPDGTFLASKNGGSATIYTLPTAFQTRNEENEYITIEEVFYALANDPSITISNLVNMEIVHTSGEGNSAYNYYGLTDPTKNGDVTITLTDGGI